MTILHLYQLGRFLCLASQCQPRRRYLASWTETGVEEPIE